MAAPCRNTSSGKGMYSIFMCKTCHSVLSEGTALCGHNDDLAVIAFLRVTSDVNMSETTELAMQGNLQFCAYNRLSCKGCGTLIGFNLNSATRPYTHMRELFCLLKQHLLCYLIESKTTLEGTRLHFDFTEFTDSLRELKESLVDLYMRVEVLTHLQKKLLE
ncbi:protein Mis18-beta [Mantella aurantiaca]